MYRVGSGFFEVWIVLNTVTPELVDSYWLYVVMIGSPL
jgi:hypothetical protein